MGWLATQPLKTVRRVVVAVIGGTVLLLGVALIVLPGPAFIVIPAGLAILATEFAWARRWWRQAKVLGEESVRTPRRFRERVRRLWVRLWRRKR